MQTNSPLVATLAQTWNLSDLQPLPGATCSLVFAATRDHQTRVLKIPLDPDEATLGPLAARAFEGHGGVPILQSDPETGAILMPRLGNDLHEHGLTDEEATRTCAALIRQLQTAPQINSPLLETWYTELTRNGRLPDKLVRKAREVADHLFRTTDSRVLLHGDLHHFNILKSGDGWLAIDPKGVLGDPAFEPSAFIRNPVPHLTSWPDLQTVMRRRIEIFSSELDLPAERIWGWAFAQTTLAAVWSDGEFGECWSRLAQALAELEQEITRTRP